MEYKPSLPEHNDNIGHEHPLKDLLGMLVRLLVAAALVYWCLGLLVNAIVERISPETEAALYKVMPFDGPKAPPELLTQQAKVRALVDSMRQCAGMAAPVTVHLVASEQANAAVVPNAHVYVFSGLLARSRSENGLAFVLAHEMAHIRQRDHLRAVGRALVLVTVTTMVTGDATGLTELIVPATRIGEASYSREREAAADALALKTLHCKYGHAGGATEFFESLKADDKDASGMPHYLASHPSMEDRIASIKRAIADAGMPTRVVEPLAPAFIPAKPDKSGVGN